MQLNNFPRRFVADRRRPEGIATAIAAAACSLLGSNVSAAEEGKWQVDMALMGYSETDRVTAVEPVIELKRELADEEFVGIKLVVDALTGSSHNGAAVRPYAQTFTSPSGGGGGGEEEEEEDGEGGYTTPAGEVPLDPSFEDTRVAVSVNWDRPLENRLWKMGLGANMSSEFDFFSLGVSGTLARDFNKRNTTVVGGLSLENDIISPVGGVPIPLSGMTAGERGAEQETRTVTDLLIGVTQVLSRTTIAQLNFTTSMSSGYHTDPYKIVGNDAVYMAPGDFYYESRPDSRTRNALYAGIKQAVGRDMLDVSYRYLTDDWDIQSHTVDARYRMRLGDYWFIEPHARWYTQTAANFWVEALPSAPTVGSGEYASGDYRLGVLDDTTYGLRVGRRSASGSEISLKAESFEQTGDTEPANVSAIIVELGYSFRW